MDPKLGTHTVDHRPGHQLISENCRIHATFLYFGQDDKQTKLH